MSTLLFEPLEPSHATALHPLWSDREVVRYTNWELCTTTEESAERIDRLLRRYADDPKRLGPFVVLDGDSQLLGLIGVDRVDGEHELWYLVHRGFWGRGFGTAMVARMLDQAADLGIERVVATAAAANTASWRLLERHGFGRTATLVHGFRKHGVRADLHRYERAIQPRGGARPPSVSWDELVLPQAELGKLHAIASRASAARGAGRAGPSGPSPPGCVLFAGAPGTGKTLAAAAVAAALGRPLYRVDLGQLASKHVGETEKNLERAFAEAGQQGAVLLLDEADALFGRRGQAQDAHEPRAEAALDFLLNRIEAHPGLVILAANRRRNLEAALVRRMAEVVDFPMPDRAAREAIWRRHLPSAPGDAPLDYARLARMKIDGGTIRNVAARARLHALASDEPLTLSTVLEAAAAERRKPGSGNPDGEP